MSETLPPLIPMDGQMTILEVAELAATRFRLDQTDFAQMEVGLQGDNGELVAVRLTVQCRNIRDLSELDPPIHYLPKGQR